MPFQQLRQRFVGLDADFEQLAAPAEHGGGETGVEQQPATRFGWPAGAQMDQCPPWVQHPLHQQFATTAAGLAPEQTRRDDPGVVEHQQIAGAQQIRQLAKHPVGEHAGRAVQGQQPAVAAPGRRMLGNQFRRQVETKILSPQRVGPGLRFPIRSVIVEPLPTGKL